MIRNLNIFQQDLLVYDFQILKNYKNFYINKFNKIKYQKTLIKSNLIISKNHLKFYNFYYFSYSNLNCKGTRKFKNFKILN